MDRTERQADQPGLWPAAGSADQKTTARATPRRRQPSDRSRSTHRDEVPGLWHIEDVAAYFDVSVDTVYGWRPKRYGPPAIKVGKHLRWRPEVVIAWAKEQERRIG